MITCLGLVVGAVTTPYMIDVLNQCAKYLKKYMHLSQADVVFEVDNEAYACVIDTFDAPEGFYVMFETYDGHTHTVRV